MDQQLETLKRFGISVTESKVYLQILKDGETSPYQLSRETGVPRTTVYETIANLALLGLITLQKSDGFTKQQTKIMAKNPSELREIIRRKRRELSVLDVDVVDMLYKLREDYQISSASPKTAVNFYPGIEGAKKVLMEEAMDDADAPSFVMDYQTPMDAYGKEFLNNYVSVAAKVHKKLHYKTKEIFPLNEWSRHATTYQYERDNDYIEVTDWRYLDDPVFELKTRTVIKENIVRMTCNEEGETWGMVIKSGALAKNYMAMFNLIWRMGVPVTKKVVESWGKNEFFEVEKKRAKLACLCGFEKSGGL